MHLTMSRSANTVDLVVPKEPSRIRYTEYWRGTLAGTLGRSLQGFVDLGHSSCSVVKSIADRLRKKTRAFCSDNTAVNTVSNKMHKINSTCINAFWHTVTILYT